MAGAEPLARCTEPTPTPLASSSSRFRVPTSRPRTAPGVACFLACSSRADARHPVRHRRRVASHQYTMHRVSPHRPTTVTEQRIDPTQGARTETNVADQCWARRAHTSYMSNHELRVPTSRPRRNFRGATCKEPTQVLDGIVATVSTIGASAAYQPFTSTRERDAAARPKTPLNANYPE
jgi:hypothetical protein